jgi:hypothetical protein
VLGALALKAPDQLRKDFSSGVRLASDRQKNKIVSSSTCHPMTEADERGLLFFHRLGAKAKGREAQKAEKARH